MSDYWNFFWNNNPILQNESSLVKVQRSLNGKPIDKNIWKQMVEFVLYQLDIHSESNVLDLCSGNGTFSVPISEIAQRVLSVDISKILIDELENYKIRNIETKLMDVNKFDSVEIFSHAIIMGSIQYFSEKEVLILLEKIYSNLKQEGVFYIGSIPDRLKLWNFASTKYYESLYFENLKKDTPAIGTWFVKDDLVKMSEYVGFSKIEIIDLPDWMHDARCRFDMKLTK
ncbi:MAG: class I SAM-dependent methyltransferase [Fusobacteriaceae bacterium]|jgi:cyclopropane fatty-acyl-phospholipid synthase-like methyltransferase|nr:class I SAM-dependent methyltransferase [Fusobacteriaceae bacterium]